MKTKTNELELKLTSLDRQLMPLPGEVDPKDAYRVALQLAAVAKLKIGPTEESPSKPPPKLLRK